MSFGETLLENGGDLQVALFFGALALFLVLQRLLPRRKQGTNHRRALSNWSLMALNVAVLSLVPISFIGAALWANGIGLGLLNLWTLPTVWVVLITLLIRGFISFFTHLLNHKIPWLWRLHRVHHLDTELDVSTTLRAHPAELLTSPFIGVPIVLGFGLSPWVLAFYELLDVIVTVFSHSNTRLPERVDRVLHYIIVTPDLHRIHHSSWQPETDSNYGALFPIWDLVFGTFRASPRDGHENMQIGLKELRDPDANGFLKLLLSPIHKTLGESDGSQQLSEAEIPEGPSIESTST